MKKNKLWKVMSLMLVLSFLLVGCGGEEKKTTEGDKGSSNGESIKIGFLGAKNGNHAAFGIPTLEGMKMAAEDINKAGGLLGKKIEIIEEDHGSKNTEGANVTQKLITRDKVVAIVGDPTTAITKIAAPIAQEKKVVLLSAGAVGTGVVENGDYIFRDTLLDAVAAPAVTKYVKENLGWKKVAVITSMNNDYSVGLSKLFRAALVDNGIEIVAEQSIQDGDQNFSAQVTAIKEKNPDGIVFTGYYTEGGLFMKEVRKQGMKTVMVGGDGLLGDVLMKMGGEAVEGSMIYCGFAADENKAGEKTKKFIEAYKTGNNGTLPDMFAAQGYDAVMLIADAIKAANSDVPEKFRAELAKTKDWTGVSGIITFQENREPIKSPVYLLEVKGGKFTVKETVEIK
ncbi:amino acid/amide ABC transporter substrate-binding protein, HAAT family [Desulforamulus reducens MI-1]|uniref:Amino acid/amide ABC transporter substrate-binding protein, HAAT family n=1 Tax=Desulforamulus reducens (strain ATCC BAA-1160 / DSM 100696 / MI-1) TaxID=349161 RepID=A4J594_DESRM|nr:ABC transporter substrate-binding protein [Desulforamulus reducens]ABO50247.1 amino acid/amide ABC transporter substrate-binding protein, HAAT family [Desulforamulus reducens MI-1]